MRKGSIVEMIKNKLVLFIFLVLIFFVGLSLAQIITSAIACLINGFSKDLLLALITGLPYIMNLFIALVLASVIFFLIFRKRK